MVTLRRPLGVLVSSTWANNRKAYSSLSPLIPSLAQVDVCSFMQKCPIPEFSKNEREHPNSKIDDWVKSRDIANGQEGHALTLLRLTRDWREKIEPRPGERRRHLCDQPEIYSLVRFFSFILKTILFNPLDTPTTTTEKKMILRILVYSHSVVILCTVANAQFTPFITTGASSSFVENKAIYISGGFNRPQRVVPQTFAIGNSFQNHLR